MHFTRAVARAGKNEFQVLVCIAFFRRKTGALGRVEAKGGREINWQSEPYFVDKLR